NTLSTYSPHFLALSASSPYWMGQDTGLASSRSKVFEALPTAGLPYQLSGWSQFEDFMETLVSATAISSIREVWWDIGPHPALDIVGHGPSYLRQRDVVASGGTLVDVVDSLVDELRTDRPRPLTTAADDTRRG